MNFSNLSDRDVALLGVIVSVIFSVLTILTSVWYTRRTFHVSTIPAVSIWVKLDSSKITFANQGDVIQRSVVSVNVDNYSENVAISDVLVTVSLIVPKRWVKDKTYIFLEESRRLIEPKKGFLFRSFDDLEDQSEYRFKGIEPFLVDEIGILEVINPDHSIFLHYGVIDQSAIKLRAQVSYTPALHGSKRRIVKHDYTLLTVTKPNAKGGMTLADFNLIDKNPPH